MASPFWQYFHDRLNWLPIFRPGPLSAIARGLALHMDEARQDILWLRDQWIVTRADMELLEKYGESRGVTRFSFDTDESYRNRVYNAFVWHKLGGKTRGVERIYAENGLRAEISPSPDPELWAHFRVLINVTDFIFDLHVLELSFWLANEFKPARSVLEGIWTYGQTPMERIVAIGLRGMSHGRSRLWFRPPAIPRLPSIKAISQRAHTQTGLRLYFPVTGPQTVRLATSPGIKSWTSSRPALLFAMPPRPGGASGRSACGCMIRTGSCLGILPACFQNQRRAHA